MSIEEKIFQKTKVNYSKLLTYGFTKKDKVYTYTTNIMNDDFKVVITITDNLVEGHIYDLNFNEEYHNFRNENFTGNYVAKIREEFEGILNDIKNNCTTTKLFIYEQANRIAKLIKEKYGDDPQFEWEDTPDCAVFKHPKKWYGIIMHINKNKLDPTLNEDIEIMNVKLDPEEILNLLKEEGFYKAYHMNKKYWITFLLDDTLNDETIMDLITKSYNLVS